MLVNDCLLKLAGTNFFKKPSKEHRLNYQSRMDSFQREQNKTNNCQHFSVETQILGWLVLVRTFQKTDSKLYSDVSTITPTTQLTLPHPAAFSMPAMCSLTCLSPIYTWVHRLHTSLLQSMLYHLSSEVQGQLKATNSWNFLCDPNDNDTCCLAPRIFVCMICKQKASFLIRRIIFHLGLSPYNILA